MLWFRISFRLSLFSVLFAVLHYTLPQHDVVRVVDTFEERQDLDDWTRIFWSRQPVEVGDGQQSTVGHDVQFIQTVKQKTYLLGFIRRDATGPMVYRNEDTGFSWPFYFKLDTSSLKTEFDDMKSTAENPKWAVVTHYGWRSEFFSIFPNAISVRAVEGPNQRIIPWFNIFFFIALIIGWFFVRAMWMQLRERSIDPLVDSAEHRLDEVQAGVAKRRGRLRGWINTWRSKDKQQ